MDRTEAHAETAEDRAATAGSAVTDPAPPLSQRVSADAGHVTRGPAAGSSAPRWRPFVAPAIAVSALAALGLYLYVPGLYEVSTDDAYVDAHIVSVVPKVAAYVAALHIDDNTKVAAGALLVELDPRDYTVVQQSATADLESAQANLDNVEAQLREQQAVIGEGEAAVNGDRSMLEFAHQQLERYGQLAKTGFGTTERLEQAQSDIGQRDAALKRDTAALDAAHAHLDVLDTQRRQAQAMIARQKAALAQAELNLSYTKIYAVAAGTVAKKVVEVGNFVQPGQVLFSLVPEEPYVVANFKETQLENIRPGQPATIRIDAFPTLRLRGHVDSIQSGTGSQFALLPPENATGNFVKVVQRVPVKIMLDDPAEALHWIAPGMSVEAEIAFAKKPWWVERLTRLGSSRNKNNRQTLTRRRRRRKKKITSQRSYDDDDDGTTRSRARGAAVRAVGN